MSSKARIIIFVTFVIGFIWLLFVLFGSRNSSKTTKVENKPVVLTDYANRDSKVVLTIDGRINGDDLHRQVRITVGRGSRLAEVIQGYQGNVINSQSQENNPNAYDEFIRALAKTGYGKDRKTAVTDVRGICPEGQRYIFEIIDNNDTVSRTWSSSCTKGTSLASPGLVLSLFKAQITDYSKLTSTTSL